MTATYNPSLTAPRDRIRFAVGDTNVAAALVPDETIDALLVPDGATETTVAAAVAQSILTIYQQRVTYDVDGQGERFSDLAKNYASTVALLNQKAAAEAAAGATEEAVAAAVAMGGGIMVGGVKQSDIIERSRDPDRAANYTALGHR